MIQHEEIQELKKELDDVCAKLAQSDTIAADILLVHPLTLPSSRSIFLRRAFVGAACLIAITFAARPKEYQHAVRVALQPGPEGNLAASFVRLLLQDPNFRNYLFFHDVLTKITGGLTAVLGLFFHHDLIEHAPVKLSDKKLIENYKKSLKKRKIELQNELTRHFAVNFNTEHFTEADARLLCTILRERMFDIEESYIKKVGFFIFIFNHFMICQSPILLVRIIQLQRMIEHIEKTILCSQEVHHEENTQQHEEMIFSIHAMLFKDLVLNTDCRSPLLGIKA